MHLRRTTALSVASLLLGAPLLSSCGFNYATDRPYTPAAGTNDRDGSVDVLGASIVSANPGSGTFIASLSNNDQTKSVSLDGIEAAGGDDLQAQGFQPRDITPGGLLNLSADGGIPVKGSFKAGDVISVTVSLDNGERTTMDVPVVADSGYFAGYDTTASGSASPSDGASPSGGASPSAPNDVASSGSQGATSSPSPTE